MLNNFVYKYFQHKYVLLQILLNNSNIMSKFFLTISMLLSLSLLSVSCNNDDFNGELPNDGAVEVSFVLDVEAVHSSRAISDGTGATQLMYAVFDENAQLVIPKAVKGNISSLLTAKGYEMSISLPKGNVYRVVFWAQNPECQAYDVADDMNVTIDYTGINNDESRDAFFACTEQFKVDYNTSVSVVLRRPFAQVNVGAYSYDMEHAREAGVDIAKSSAIIKSVPNSINLLDGKTAGEVDVTYTLAARPAENLLVDVDENGTSEVYEYLSMSYLLATPEGSVHEMSFGFTNEDETKRIEFNGGLETVPVKRNWRTNIVGQILTGNVSFNIKIDPSYEGETINSAGLYYNFSEDTEIVDKVFAFNTNEAATFSSENNNLLTFKNVVFSGKVQYIALGDYVKNEKNQVVVPFTNILTNVVAKDMVVTHSKGITNVASVDYMAPLIFLRGESTLYDCEFTGTTCLVETYAQQTADKGYDYYEVLPYDCGVPNDSKAVFNDCTIGTMYAWSHSQITLNNTKVEYLRCSTHNQSDSNAHVTINAGSEVETIFVSSSSTAKSYTGDDGRKHWKATPWAPSLIIKSGAKIGTLDMNGRGRYDVNGNLDVVIEDGAIIDSIINEAV